MLFRLHAACIVPHVVYGQLYDELCILLLIMDEFGQAFGGFLYADHVKFDLCLPYMSIY